MNQSGLTLRDIIEQQAHLLGYQSSIENLSDGEAIRFLQRKQGFSSCFGSSTPYSTSSGGECGQYGCLWYRHCHAYRRSQRIMPLEKALPNADRSFLTTLRVRLSKLASTQIERNTIFVGVRLSSLMDITDISRKMVVASPKTVLTENPENRSNLRGWIIESKQLIECGSLGRTKHEIIYTSDVHALYVWMEDAQAFIQDGSLSYAPLMDIAEPGLTKSEYYSPKKPFAYPQEYHCATMFSTPHIAVPDGSISVNTREMIPLFNVDVPVLEGVDLHTLNKIIADNPDSLSAFRYFLLEQIQCAQEAALGSEQFSTQCRRIERAIHSELRRLKTDISAKRIKTAITLAGGGIATWTLALFCIIQGKADILSLLGPSGVICTLSATYVEHIVQELKLRDKPVYFLWLLGRSRR